MMSDNKTEHRSFDNRSAYLSLRQQVSFSLRNILVPTILSTYALSRAPLLLQRLNPRRLRYQVAASPLAVALQQIQ